MIVAVILRDAIRNIILTIIAFVLTLISSFILISFTDITLAIYIGIYVFFISLFVKIGWMVILLFQKFLPKEKRMLMFLHNI